MSWLMCTLRAGGKSVGFRQSGLECPRMLRAKGSSKSSFLGMGKLEIPARIRPRAGARASRVAIAAMGQSRS